MLLNAGRLLHLVEHARRPAGEAESPLPRNASAHARCMLQELLIEEPFLVLIFK